MDYNSRPCGQPVDHRRKRCPLVRVDVIRKPGPDTTGLEGAFPLGCKTRIAMVPGALVLSACMPFRSLRSGEPCHSAMAAV